VWEVVRAVRSARAAEPDLDKAELVGLVEDNTGVPRRMLRTALEYWGAYPDEVEAFVVYVERTEVEHAAPDARTASCSAVETAPRPLLDEMIGPRVALALRGARLGRGGRGGERGAPLPA
jgi:hypothetical protein